MAYLSIHARRKKEREPLVYLEHMRRIVRKMASDGAMNPLLADDLCEVIDEKILRESEGKVPRQD